VVGRGWKKLYFNQGKKQRHLRLLLRIPEDTCAHQEGENIGKNSKYVKKSKLMQEELVQTTSLPKDKKKKKKKNHDETKEKKTGQRGGHSEVNPMGGGGRGTGTGLGGADASIRGRVRGLANLSQLWGRMQQTHTDQGGAVKKRERK